MNKLFLFSFLLVSVLGARRTATPPTVAHKHLEYRFPSFWGIGYPLEVIPEDEIKKVEEVKEVKVGTWPLVACRLYALVSVFERKAASFHISQLLKMDYSQEAYWEEDSWMVLYHVKQPCVLAFRPQRSRGQGVEASRRRDGLHWVKHDDTQ